MSRPPVEVADIVRSIPTEFIDKSRRWLTWQHVKVLRAIQRCRTPALGGHIDSCSQCGHRAISYNSCRNRHCPKCQTNSRERWIALRQQELLPVPYFHVVFTLPHELAGLALQNKRLLYELLFQASAQTLLETAADPEYFGAQIGFISVLHTWGQNLLLHPHVHCIVPGGGLAPDGSSWKQKKRTFFLPVRVLSRVFRDKFLDGLTDAFRQGKLCLVGDLQYLASSNLFRQLVAALRRKKWVVHAKPPFGGATHVLQVSGSLHPSCRHQQSSSVELRWQTSHVPLERLRTWQQEAKDDPARLRVPAPFSFACPPRPIRTHPALRPTGQSPPNRNPYSMQAVDHPDSDSHNDAPARNACSSRFVVLSALLRSHGSCTASLAFSGVPLRCFPPPP